MAGVKDGRLSEWLNLNSFSIKTHFGHPNLMVLQFACADLGHARKFVVSRAGNNVYSSLGASNPLLVLIKSKREIGGLKLLDAEPLPGTHART